MLWAKPVNAPTENAKLRKRSNTYKKIATNAYMVTPANVDMEDAKIKAAPRRSEPQPEPKEAANEDFSDFNWGHSEPVGIHMNIQT